MTGNYTGTGRGDGRPPIPPNAFPQPPNVNSTGGYPTFPTYPYAPSQQPQAVGHSRSPPPPPPPRFPAQPAYPNIGDHTSAVPRGLDPAPFQLGTGYVDVNNHGQSLFPLPQGLPQGQGSRAPDLGSAHYGLVNPGPGRTSGPEPPRFLGLPVPSSGRASYGGSSYGGSSYGGSSYGGSSHGGSSHGGSSYVFESTPQVRNPSIRPSATPTQPQPQQPYGVGSHQHRAPVSQLHPPRVGHKKAVVIGINYSKHKDRKMKLEWGVYDAQVMARFLQEHLGFHPHNIRILTDDKHDKRENRPTEANIVAAMRWLVEGAQSGDSLFLYFSGHATQIEDKDGDEPDGWDECVCAMDYNRKKSTGLVVDDTMHDIMVKPLPEGCRLTAVFDCCHSGTILDLPYIYDSHGVVKQNRIDIVRRKTSEAVVISLSACKDNGEAFEAGGGGALRRAFIQYAIRWGNGGTHLQALESLRAYMAKNGYEQRPQLSSSHWIDTDQRFIITG